MNSISDVSDGASNDTGNDASNDTSNNADNEAVATSADSMTMNNQEALNIIQALVDGINPLSDEPLTDNSLCRSSDIQRALQTAIPALESRIRYNIRQSKLPANAGKPWDDAEDEQLLAAFDKDNSITALVEQHQRTKGSITSRLLKFGKMVN